MNPDPTFAEAVRRLNGGDPAGAEAACRALLAAAPGHADGWQLLGVALSSLGRPADAADAFRRAAELRPGPAAWNNLAEALRAAGDPAGALAQAERAAAAAPTLPEAHHNSGHPPKKQGARAQAARPAAPAPTLPEAHLNCGNALKALGRLEEAIDAYGRAAGLRPGYHKALYNLGNALRETGRAAAAVEAYRRALAVRPDAVDALVNLGNALKDDGRPEEALACYRRALELDPRRPDLHASAGIVLAELGRLDEARACYARDAAARPADWWRPLRAAGLLPPVAAGREEIDADRAALAAAVERLRPARGPLPPAELHASGVEPPMQLAYHGRDDRPLREAYAALFADALPADRPPPGDGRPHVGVVVTHGHEGVFWKCLGPLVARLPSPDLRVSVVCGRAGLGVLRQWFAGATVGLLPLPERLDAALAVLREARFDLLHYWEVGTDSTNYFLPFLRPAPLQSATWGWPVTTGNPRVDYFVSAAGLEPDDAEAHYTERLVRLPSLPTCYRRPPARPAAGVADGPRTYLCTQNVRKLHPDFDALAAGVLRADPGGEVVLLADPAHPTARRLLGRMAAAMPDVIGRVRATPRLPEAEYLALLAGAAVVLDTPHYGGGANTLYDAVAAGTPFVTLPGAFHRGRWGLAVCRALGLDDLAAGSADEYVERAVELGRNADRRRAVRARLAAAGDQLFEDERPVRELRGFFLEAIVASRAAGPGLDT